MNINDLVVRNERIFGRRNALFIDGPNARLNLLGRSIGKISDAVRKQERLEFPVSNAVMWWGNCINGFNGHIDPAQSIVSKFPEYGCGYCGEKPCQCSNGKRAKHCHNETPYINKNQNSWSIRKWVEHFSEVYGPANCQKSKEELVNRLFKEVEEVRELLSSTYVLDQKQMIKELGAEFADVFAWLVQLSYIFEFDLEKSIGDFFSECPRCKNILCSCPRFFENGNLLDTIGSVAILKR